MEFVTIKIPKDNFDLLINSDLLDNPEIKLIEIKDEFFALDPMHKKLKDKAHKAYKELKEYEFNIRNKQTF